MLQPLKEATKRLNTRSKLGRFSAIYKVIPVFKAILSVYEQLLKAYDNVNYDEANAPKAEMLISRPADLTPLGRPAYSFKRP